MATSYDSVVLQLFSTANMKLLLLVLLPVIATAAPTFNVLIPGISSFVSDAVNLMRWKLDRIQDVLSPTTTTPRPILLLQPYNPPPPAMHLPPPSLARNVGAPLPPPTFSMPPPNFNIRAPPPISSARGFAPPPPSSENFAPAPLSSFENFAPPPSPSSNNFAPPPPSSFENFAPPAPPPLMSRNLAPAPMQEVIPPAGVDSSIPPIVPPPQPDLKTSGQPIPKEESLTPFLPEIIVPATSLPLESGDDKNKLKRNANECRVQNVHGQLGNSKYYFSWNDPSMPRKSWIEADRSCSARCMKLVSLDSAAENALVKMKMGRDGVTRTWTSGKLDAQGWHWAANQTRSNMDLQDWFRDQPDNRQTCLSVRVELNETRDVGGWHTFNCDVVLPFICEI